MDGLLLARAMTTLYFPAQLSLAQRLAARRDALFFARMAAAALDSLARKPSRWSFLRSISITPAFLPQSISPRGRELNDAASA